MENKKRKAYIYKITSPAGKCYIGRTCDIKRRIRDYSKFRCMAQKKLFYSLLAYGFEAHKIDILMCEELTEQELFDEEIRLIKQHDSVTNGLNILNGGSGFSGVVPRRGFKLSDEQKQKISEARTGYKHTNESKLLISKNNAMRNPDHKAKMIDSVKRSMNNPALKKHLSDFQRNKDFCPNRKAVIQSELDGTYVSEFISLSEAARQTGARKNKISAVCTGERKTHFGFVWSFKS